MSACRHRLNSHLGPLSERSERRGGPGGHGYAEGPSPLGGGAGGKAPAKAQRTQGLKALRPKGLKRRTREKKSRYRPFPLPYARYGRYSCVMRTYAIQGSVGFDDAMEDGYVCHEVEDGCTYLFMTRDTYLALSAEYLLSDVVTVVKAKGPGTHLIPRSIIDAAAAREVEQHLSLLDPAPEAEQCVLPTCLQDAVSVERGFPLCVGHAEALQDWDSLIA